MKKIIAIIPILFVVNFIYAQTYTEKYNSLYERTEYFDQNGNMVAYKKWNPSYQRYDITYLNETTNYNKPRKYGEYIEPYDTEFMNQGLKLLEQRRRERLRWWNSLTAEQQRAYLRKQRQIQEEEARRENEARRLYWQRENAREEYFYSKKNAIGVYYSWGDYSNEYFRENVEKPMYIEPIQYTYGIKYLRTLHRWLKLGVEFAVVDFSEQENAKSFRIPIYLQANIAEWDLYPIALYTNMGAVFHIPRGDKGISKTVFSMALGLKIQITPSIFCYGESRFGAAELYTAGIGFRF